MGGFGFHVYQLADPEQTPLEVLGRARTAAARRWEGGDEAEEVRGILQKCDVQQLAEQAVTPDEAEKLMNRLLGLPAPGEKAVVFNLDDVPPYADHYGTVAGAIPVSYEPSGPVVSWLLFGYGNE